MALVSVRVPYLWPGGSSSSQQIISAGDTMDAAGEYVAYVFEAMEAMTVSHVGWRNAGATGSPTADVRIETVDPATGLPTGTLWATNTNIVTGALSANTWNLNALTASASIASGDFFAVKIAYNSGTSFQISRSSSNWNASSSWPHWRVLNTGTPTLGDITNHFLLALGSNATTFYRLPSSFPATAYTNTTFNSGSSPNRRGIRFQIPFKARLRGVGFATAQVGDFQLGIYNDAGTSQETKNFEGDLQRFGRANLLNTGVVINANTWYRATIEATTVTNQAISTFSLPSADYVSALPWGAFGHETTFNGSAWDDTATTTIPIMTLAFDQVDDGTGSGASGGGHILGGTVVR